MNSENKQSLIQDITSDQVSDLIEEHDLINSGYKFYYFIDSYDLNLLSYPFGLISSFDEREKKSVEIITDEQLSYDYLIRKNEFIFLFDEYFTEYCGFKDKIKRAKYLGLDVVKSVEILIEHYDRLIKKNKKSVPLYEFESLEKYISDLQVSLLLAIAVGSISNGIDKLNNLEEKNLIHSIGQLSELKIFPEDVIKCIQNSQPSNLSNNLFKKLLQNFNNPTRMEPSRLNARYIDCKVFDRLLKLNKEQLKNKIGFFLLSSSITSQRISKIASEDLSFQVLVNGKPLNLFRSINQIFLKLLFEPSVRFRITNKILGNLENEYVEKITLNTLKSLLDKDFTKEEFEIELNKLNNSNEQIKLIMKHAETSTNYKNELEIIKKLVEYREKDFNSKDSIDEHILKHLESRIVFLRESFEDASLIMNFINFKKSIEQAFNNQDLMKSKYVIPALKNLMELSNQKSIIKNTRIKNLNELIFERNYKNTLSIGIDNIKNEKITFEICPGSDCITNSYHHLPLVYFLNSSKENYDKVINDIVKFLTEIDPKKRDSKFLINSIYSSLFLLFEKALPSYEEHLIRLLILALLRTENDDLPEELAYNKGSEILGILTDDNVYRKEFLYFLSWIARRKTEYYKALEFAEKGIKIDNKDPRFYQSKALIFYCLYKNTNNIEHLKTAIANSKISLQYYLEIRNPSLAIEKSIIALYNTNCYLLCLLYTNFNFEKNTKFLFEARKNIDELKQRESKFKDIPEFLHTEALLIKLEIETNINIPNSIKNLDYSIKIISKAIELNPKSEYLMLKEELTRIFHSKLINDN